MSITVSEESFFVVLGVFYTIIDVCFAAGGNRKAMIDTERKTHRETALFCCLWGHWTDDVVGLGFEILAMIVPNDSRCDAGQRPLMMSSVGWGVGVG